MIDRDLFLAILGQCWDSDFRGSLPAEKLYAALVQHERLLAQADRIANEVAAIRAAAEQAAAHAMAGLAQIREQCQHVQFSMHEDGRRVCRVCGLETGEAAKPTLAACSPVEKQS